MQLKDLQIVLKVAEYRHITAAAASLNIRTATASAALKRIEKKLGAELFIRTTRQLRLSPAGERFVPECAQAIALLEHAKTNVQHQQSGLNGEIRIALSSDLGRNLVNRWLDEFLEEYPQLSLHSHISDHNIDFYSDSIDMALRYGKPNDASMYGFKICNVPYVICVSTDYNVQYGCPLTPQELKAHNGLFYQKHDLIQNQWEFRIDHQLHKIKLSGNRVTNDADLVRRWCVNGKGYAIKASIEMADDLFHHRVVQVLQDNTPPPLELWLVCPSRQSITPVMRALRDLFRDKCHQLLEQMVEAGFIHDGDVALNS